MNKGFEVFDCIIGKTKDNILNYFGKVEKNYNNILVYQREVGKIVVFIRLDENMNDYVSGFAIFSGENELLYSNGITLMKEEEKEELLKMSSLNEIFESFGIPAAEIGRGRTIFAYVSEKCDIVSVEVGEKNRVVLSEISL